MTKLTYNDGQNTYEFDLSDPEQKAVFDKGMDTLYDEWGKQANVLSDTLGVSLACANDVLYLRTRSRHTPEMEARLIALHKAGNPPNVMEFS